MGGKSEASNKRAHEFKMLALNYGYNVVKLGLICATVVGCAWAIAHTVSNLAGTSTNVVVDLGLKMLARLDLTFGVSIAIGGAGWGAIERLLRHRAVRRLEDENKALKLRVDPGRGTSHLAPGGKTNKKDRGV